MNRWDDIYEVSLPLPFALKAIKSYVIRGSNGFTLIDTGLSYWQAHEAWEKARQEIGFDWTDVEKIVLTHYHPDHYGMAGMLQERCQAPVLMTETDYNQAALFFGRESDQPDRMARFYGEHGLPEEWTKQIPAHLRGFTKWVEPHPEPTFIQAGETIQLGDYSYEILHTPGHADGHVSFYDPARRLLIGGDFLLPKITPNISLWPECDPNPLDSYLTTLDKMKPLAVDRVFPSHGPVFEHYRERIQELMKHHGERLAEMKEWVTRKPLTATEVCFRIFGKNLSVHNLRFALSETLAHLEYLRQNGQIRRERKSGHWIYLT
ncbi:Glyoxylase, beta-lactamase superfamily II [Marininema mesophilum]|uniref:Glyoxylase, beta-lactamase superfamily II n=1 Tax=Marininema mesophilum TaxID=1048340 RepID=A0A1H3CEP8_9BACL|nr:MBL fold metallo-hydrolase [Marininema mesophilum]SDX52565.1 Glyoxylase, beta-lactamase superfamily II [Marininema mesophilum]